MRQKTPNCERFFSLKISWDRARAERAILRVFGGIRAAGVGPKTILKIERRTAKNNLTKSAVKKTVGLRAMMRGSGPGPGLRSRPHVFKPHPPTTLERATDMSLGGLHSCIL